jgi:hypothetical protein
MRRFQMSKNLGKVVLISLLVVAMAAPVFATTTRVNSLAGTGNYINDDSNIFHWYGVLPSYANLVMTEVGTWYGSESLNSQAMGMTYSVGEDGHYGTWGVFLLRNVADNSFFSSGSPIGYGAYNYDGLTPPGYSTQYTPMNKLALMWGKQMEKFALGLSFTRSDESSDIKYAVDPEHKTDKAYTTFGAGIRADINDKTYTDIAVTVGFGSYDETGDTLHTFSKDKGTSLDFSARMFYEWKDNITFVPAIEYFQSEYSLQRPSWYPEDTYAMGDKMRGFLVGAALNFDVNTNNLLIFGAELSYYKDEPSDPGTGPNSQDAYKEWALPTFYLALESNVKPWLTARMGAWKELSQETYTHTEAAGTGYVAKDNKYTDSYFQWYLGLGFHVAEFDIDAQLGPDAPFNVGYWLTGYSQWDTAPITRMSATYHF